MDSFQIIFDTFRDQQNGFVFGTNAAGIQYDAQVRDQGDASVELGRKLGRQDAAPTETGWTAEFRIPLRTLRYGPPPQTWGVNFFRNIQRSRERTYWAPLPRAVRAGAAVVGRRAARPRARDAAQLQDPALRRQLGQPRISRRAPRPIWTATSGSTRSSASRRSLNLDVTYNTDFAQVEVDTQQINLTRFNLRFPEKRPFFLENSGAVHASARANELDLFFSRRIGLDEDGQLVPIRGGARLSGKAGGFNVGVLNMQTDDVGHRPANNFTVAAREPRAAEPLGRRRDVRQPDATGSLARSGDWNRTLGADGAARASASSVTRRRLRGADRDAGADRTRLRLQRRLRVRRRQASRRRSSTA